MVQDTWQTREQGAVWERGSQSWRLALDAGGKPQIIPALPAARIRAGRAAGTGQAPAAGSEKTVEASLCSRFLSSQNEEKIVNFFFFLKKQKREKQKIKRSKTVLLFMHPFLLLHALQLSLYFSLSLALLSFITVRGLEELEAKRLRRMNSQRLFLFVSLLQQLLLQCVLPKESTERLTTAPPSQLSSCSHSLHIITVSL